MTQPRFVTIVDRHEPARVLVTGWARDLLDEHGHRARWSNIDRGWWLPRASLPDLLAQAAEAGVRVRQVVR